MPPTVPLLASPLNWKDLSLVNVPSSVRLEQIKGYLDILLLALASLTPLEATDLQRAIQELQLEQFQLDPGFAGPLSHPRQWGSDKNVISIEEARSLVMIVCHLARDHQELLRRAVTLMEQMAEQGKDPARTALLGEYLMNFQELYSPHRFPKVQSPGQELQPFAFKLLIDLLFYGATNGHRRLWLVLLE